MRRRRSSSTPTLARRAIRAGSLRIALPDGTTYPVRMEHQSTDAAGRWSVIGPGDDDAPGVGSQWC
jgi:hypothetical protein